MDKCTELQTVKLADEMLISDERIIELYWQRDEKAIHETEVKYGKMLFSIAYNILHDKSDCEECQNDTYLCVWKRIPPIRPTVFSAFISKIMRDIAINKYKEKSSKKRIPAELTVSIEDLHDFLHAGDTPEAEYTAKELGKIISDYVRGLSDRQQFIFMERYYLYSTIESIAEELGVGLATVHRETEKMKQGLKAHLERNGVYV